MKTLNIIIDGMSCNHCVISIKNELAKFSNIEIKNVEVGIAKIICAENFNLETIKTAIEEIGFNVITINE